MFVIPPYSNWNIFRIVPGKYYIRKVPLSYHLNSGKFLLTPVHVTNENSSPQIMASIRPRAFNTNRGLEPLQKGWLQSFLSNFSLITAHVECFIKRHTDPCSLQSRYSVLFKNQSMNACNSTKGH